MLSAAAFRCLDVATAAFVCPLFVELQSTDSVYYSLVFGHVKFIVPWQYEVIELLSTKHSGEL